MPNEAKTMLRALVLEKVAQWTLHSRLLLAVGNVRDRWEGKYRPVSGCLKMGRAGNMSFVLRVAIESIKE